jgi:hypothetical protein
MSGVTAVPSLESEVDLVLADLGLGPLLGALGEWQLVGSAALGLMVWPDIDLTVVCDRLEAAELYTAAKSLAGHERVRRITFRNDSRQWNTEPDTYPDGIYWGIEYRSTHRTWNLDIWFVTEPERQPDLRHLRELKPKLDDEKRAAILDIKREWCERPEYGTTVTSFDIYTAVLDRGARTPADFEQFIAERQS